MKKKTYEVPAMQVVQFKSEQPLMVGSSVGIESMKSQSWNWDDSSSFGDEE